jgi:tripartite-type tricarboxylate transporter receptor subunit TctC
MLRWESDRTNSMKPVEIATCFLMAAALSTGAAFGQAYPSKPIRFLVGYGAGGAADVATRLIAPRMAEAFGQPVVVDNRPGAGSLIATQLLAQSRPDGYTLMMVNISFGANPALYTRRTYDPVKDFVPVAHVDVMPNVLLVPLALPVKSAGELIALARARPGALNHAHSGIGSAGYLIFESLKHDTRIDVVHLPYQSGPQVLSAVIANEAQLGFLTIPTSLSLVKAGRARPLAVTTLKRVAALPDVPTISETVLPDFEVNEWHGVLAPAGTPKEIVARLSREINRALAIPDVRERLSGLGAEPTGGPPEKMAAFVRAEFARWKKVLKPVE